VLKRRLLLASPIMLAVPAQGQTWPSRPIRIIVPYPAGQSADILGRVMAEQLTKALGQQVIVENKPGAGGTIGVDVAAKAPPDGYTLVIMKSRPTSSLQRSIRSCPTTRSRTSPRSPTWLRHLRP
jgi:tripartite-type tricarboxylate transporter receptor subunit TctC